MVTPVEKEAAAYLGTAEDLIGECAVAFVAYLGAKAKNPVGRGYLPLTLDDSVIIGFLTAYISGKAAEFVSDPAKGYEQGYAPDYGGSAC